MKKILFLLLAAAMAASGATSTLTINTGTGLVIIPPGSATPNFAALKVGGVTISAAPDWSNIANIPAAIVTYSGIAPSANVQSLLGAANYAAAVNLLGGASSSGTGGLARIDSPSFTTKTLNGVGSAASPAYTFTGFDTSGLYEEESGNVSISVAGARALHITSSFVDSPVGFMSSTGDAGRGYYDVNGNGMLFGSPFTVARLMAASVERARVSTAGFTIGISGTPIAAVFSATATLNFGSILAAASADLTITVTGAAVGDAVFLGLPAAPDASIVYNAFVSAADTVTVRAYNVGAIADDPASATYRATVFHY